MKPVHVAAWLAVGLALAAWAAAPAQAQTHQCPKDGSLLLVFRNPDLQPQTDGFIHAQGQFFAQFQAIGKDADKIAVLGFSFGPDTVDFPDSACDEPVWVTGAYIPNYRADRDASDGFFIPIKTPLVPDGTYAAAVHAYDANNNELARFWGRAVVDNCDAQTTPAQEKCDGDAAQMQKHDKTAPWPIVLPGDGQALAGHKLTFEFGEPLADHGLAVFLNGKDITANLTQWDGRLWDADYIPDYGPYGVGGLVAPPCSQQPPQQCEHYGPAYEWTGRDLTDADVVRVEATDLAGNKAVKDIHIGSSVAGGAITQPDPSLQVTPKYTLVEGVPGKHTLFEFNITNSGGGDGHPFAQATGPSGWSLDWNPVHVMVPPGQTKSQMLVITLPADAAPGTYPIQANFTYQVGGKDKVLGEPLKVVVREAPGNSERPSSSPSNSSSSKAAPGADLLLVPLLGVAALAGRRPRRFIPKRHG
jgi:MYXO-CTERM domain-containing protein